MIFVVAKALEVQPDEPGVQNTVVIHAGETVRLIPEFAATTTAHLIWDGHRFVCDRSVFLESSSPVGPAPD